jgi:hypothetical protein
LGGRGNLFFHRQEGEEVFVIVVVQKVWRFVFEKRLKFGNPIGVGFEGFRRIMPNADFVGKGGMGLVPRGKPMLGRGGFVLPLRGWGLGTRRFLLGRTEGGVRGREVFATLGRFCAGDQFWAVWFGFWLVGRFAGGRAG